MAAPILSPVDFAHIWPSHAPPPPSPAPRQPVEGETLFHQQHLLRYIHHLHLHVNTHPNQHCLQHQLQHQLTHIPPPTVKLRFSPACVLGGRFARARHTPHVTRHTSHVTRRMSHVTRHTSHSISAARVLCASGNLQVCITHHCTFAHYNCREACSIPVRDTCSFVRCGCCSACRRRGR